ncbi:MAG TPA: sensor histidine kinase, partial [Chitinophagaceae bacterium]
LPGGDDEHYIIEVKNDGFLVPYEMKEKIFETFYRLKETEKISGTGIGLALSRSLTELHKGVLELAPPDGELNVFRLTLPVHPQEASKPLKSTETTI